MPTAKNKYPNLSHKRLWRRKGFWAAILILVLIGYGTAQLLEYRSDQAIAHERARFEQADKDVQEVAAAMIAAAGTPLETQGNKSCSRPSTKFEEAPLSCSSSRDLFFVAPNEENANNLYAITRSQASHILRLDTVKFSNNLSAPKFEALKNDSYQQIFETHSSLRTQMTCRVTYNFYDGATPSFSGFISTDDYVLAVSLTCSGKAITEHFPLAS